MTLTFVWRAFKVIPGIALHSPLNMSQTVRDTNLVPKDHQSEMAHVESSGHVTDDVT